MKGQQKVPQRAQPVQRPVQQPQKTAPQENMPALRPQEKVIEKIYSTRVTYLKFYVIAFIMFVLWAIIQFDLYPKAYGLGAFSSFIAPHKMQFAILLVVGAILIFTGEMKIRYERYYLTNHRVRHMTGFLGTQETDFEYSMISHYSVSQNFIERFFNHGTIQIETVSGGRTAQIFLKHIPHIKKIKAVLDSKISSVRGVYGR